jgi:hypothetical protein
MLPCVTFFALDLETVGIVVAADTADNVGGFELIVRVEMGFLAAIGFGAWAVAACIVSGGRCYADQPPSIRRAHLGGENRKGQSRAMTQPPPQKSFFFFSHTIMRFTLALLLAVAFVQADQLAGPCETKDKTLCAKYAQPITGKPWLGNPCSLSTILKKKCEASKKKEVALVKADEIKANCGLFDEKTCAKGATFNNSGRCVSCVWQSGACTRASTAIEDGFSCLDVATVATSPSPKDITIMRGCIPTMLFTAEDKLKMHDVPCDKAMVQLWTKDGKNTCAKCTSTAPPGANSGKACFVSQEAFYAC